jgi:hypothetical protein
VAGSFKLSARILLYSEGLVERIKVSETVFAEIRTECNTREVPFHMRLSIDAKCRVGKELES